jgi:hypothetical protein
MCVKRATWQLRRPTAHRSTDRREVDKVGEDESAHLVHLGLCGIQPIVSPSGTGLMRYPTNHVSGNKQHQTQPISQQVRSCLCWPCIVTIPPDQAPRWGIKRRRIKALARA